VKLLVLSRMFPSERHPTSVIFFAKFLLQLNPWLEKILVVSPRVYIPWVLSFRQRWARHRNVTKHGEWQGIEVVRPPVAYVRSARVFPYLGRMNALTLWHVVRRLHRRIGFDAVLGFNALPDGDAAVRLAGWLRLPAVVWCIGSDLNDIAPESASTRRVARQLLERASLVVTSSATLVERAREIAPGLRRVQPFYRGVDLDLFRSQPTQQKLRGALGLPEDASVLAYVGRLMPEKGIRELFAVFQRLADRRPPVYLLLAGEDLMGAELEALVARSGAPERVVQLGLVSHERAAACLGAADVLLFGSHQEGLPNAVVEAMAAGTAVVATCVGGVPEIVRDGETGLLVPPRDAGALLHATRRLLDDTGLRARCVEGAQRLAHAQFDAARNARQFARLLGEVVEEWQNRRRGQPALSSLPPTPLPPTSILPRIGGRRSQKPALPPFHV
jgi:glycosyltransferase involved in cell wall biosynthesis